MKVSAVILLISVAVFVSPAYAKKVEIGQTVTECLAYPEACVSVVDAFLAELDRGEVDSEVAVGLLSARLYEIAGSSTVLQRNYFSESLQGLSSWSEVNVGPQSSRIKSLAEGATQAAAAGSGAAAGNNDSQLSVTITSRGRGWGKDKCGPGVGKSCSPWADFPGGGWGPPRPPHGSPN